MAIDCATAACSVALFEHGDLLAHDHQVLGRGHAERLVPMIAALPGRGQADRILVSRGPGSFTGVRIGIAVARALGLAWRAQVLGYPTLALVAAMARSEAGDQAVTVAMEGGHGEWFLQDFGADGLPDGEAKSLTPDAARAQFRPALAAGSKARDLLGDEGAGAKALDLLPDARRALLMPDALLGTDTTPIYGRAPDAQLPGQPA